MYIPKHFAQDDVAALRSLLSRYPLGAWVVAHDAELVVNHIPFFLDTSRGEHGTLVGHVARANPVWKSLSTTQPSVVIFEGEQAYISPNWQPSKQVDGKVVPTWNYAVVHAHGIASAIEERGRVLQIVSQLSDIHEASQAEPWRVADAPPAYIDALLSAIVGIEIPLQRLTGKWKLSQNRQAADQHGIVSGLQAHGDAQALAMAGCMGARLAPP